MPNRNTLGINKIEPFKKWLIEHDWVIEENKGEFDILRARKVGRRNPLIIYKRLSTNAGKELVHYTLQDRDENIYWNFLKDFRKLKKLVEVVE